MDVPESNFRVVSHASPNTHQAPRQLTTHLRELLRPKIDSELRNGSVLSELCAALHQLADELGADSEREGVKREGVTDDEMPLVVEDVSASEVTDRTTSKQLRFYVDGCFDLMHSGHYNALRQAKALGGTIIAGVHSCDEILRNKGPPVMSDEERLISVKACKWVDEVVFGTPYSPTVKLLEELNADFYVHGDDIPVAGDGTSSVAEVRDAGRLKLIKRTAGVSTTDIVGRLLLMTKDHHMPRATSLKSSGSSFLTTTFRISQFSNNRQPKPTDHIVYIDGAFDLFHSGHIETLKRARALGTFLYVGLHDDATVNSHRGKNFPIMNLHERAFNVLACKYVDEVVIGAPWVVSEDMFKTLNIHTVCSGSNTKFNASSFAVSEHVDPYAYARSRGAFSTVSTSSTLTTDDVASRIIANRDRFEARQVKCQRKEQKYLAEKQFRSEICATEGIIMSVGVK